MNDNKQVFAKVRTQDLLHELQTQNAKPSEKRKITLRKIIANLTINSSTSTDLVTLYPEIIKCLTTADFETKKLCYHYITTLSLNDVNSTMKTLPYFINDLNVSQVREVTVLALTNVVRIPIKEFIGESINPIKRFLKGSDPVLKKVAIYNVGRLWDIDSKLVRSEKIIAMIYDLIEDPSLDIVIAALTILNDIGDRQGSEVQLRFDFNQVKFLVELINKAEDWGQIQILASLMNFVPQESDEPLVLIDKVIPLLQHVNSSVVLNAFKLILYLLNYTTTVEEYLIRKLTNSLTSLLSKPSEIQFLILRNVILLILSKPKLFHFDVSLFFCVFDDPIFVKDTKLEIIYLLASDSNISLVLSELAQYSADVDVQMSRKAVRAIGNLAVKIESAADECVNVLLDLLSHDVDYVNQEVILVFKNIFRRYDQFQNIALPQLLKHTSSITDPDSKSALIWIIGNYSHVIPDAEELLRELTSSFKQDPVDLQLTSLTSVVKLYLKNSESHELTLSILKLATSGIENPDVRDRAFFYWRLLNLQAKYPEATKDIVDGEIPFISNENEQLDPRILEELELNIGTLASVYLKPVAAVFRLAKRKYLHDSPARSKTPLTTVISSDVTRPSVNPQAHTSSSSVSSAIGERARSHTATSTTSTLYSNEAALSSRHQDDFDIHGLTKSPVKKGKGDAGKSSLSRKVTMTKSSLSRKLSLRNAFH